MIEQFASCRWIGDRIPEFQQLVSANLVQLISLRFEEIGHWLIEQISYTAECDHTIGWFFIRLFVAHGALHSSLWREKVSQR